MEPELDPAICVPGLLPWLQLTSLLLLNILNVFLQV